MSAMPDEPPAGTWVIGDRVYPYERSQYPDVEDQAHWWAATQHDHVTWRAICTLHRRVDLATLEPIKKED